jgi:hypothetical protein
VSSATNDRRTSAISQCSDQAAAGRVVGCGSARSGAEDPPGTDRYTVDNALLVDTGHSGVVERGGINYHFNWEGPVMARY